MMTLVEALELMRSEPHQAQYAELLRDAYLDVEAEEAAERFHRSAEFAAVTELLSKFLGKRMRDCNVLDLGAGTVHAA